MFFSSKYFFNCSIFSFSCFLAIVITDFSDFKSFNNSCLFMSNILDTASENSSLFTASPFLFFNNLGFAVIVSTSIL